LGTTWPSLRKAFTRHGLGMPARNPEAARRRAIEAARQRSGRPATPSLDPVFVALNHGELPIRALSDQELSGTPEVLPANRVLPGHRLQLSTGAIKWSDANFGLVQVSRLSSHTLWPSP
jgi:hypothetical protein